MTARRRIFDAVFPVSTEDSVATPQATPLIGTGSFETFTGGSSQVLQSEKINVERSWHLSTEFLSIPKASITLKDARQHHASLSEKWRRDPSPAITQAIHLLLSEETNEESPRYNLQEWYRDEVLRHYLKFQLPEVLKSLSGEDPLVSTLALLETSQLVYFGPFKNLHSANHERANTRLADLRQSFSTLVSASLNESNFKQILEFSFLRLANDHFGVSRSSNDDHDDEMEIEHARDAKHLNPMGALLNRLKSVGLGGSSTSRVLARVMSKTLADFVNKTCENSWTSPSQNSLDLDTWIENLFVPFVIQMLLILEDPKEPHNTVIPSSTSEVENWKTRAVNELGALRLKQLFNLIVSWDESRGAIEDLKHYLKSATARSHIISQLSDEFSRRLLHPGASTSQILDIYIRLIQVFAVLDPRGVLLDRVARPVRRYLRAREDTVKLIVGGLLADPLDENNPDPLAILALKLEEATQNSTEDDDAGLDFDDMKWMPDPIDAEPEYKKSKSSDVIGNLISLFETRDVFVKEFQNILGERLLQTKNDFDAETRLLELLKIRFGEGALQSCEVMLRDVFDSARTDSWVRREQGMDVSMSISTKILSRLFWPALHTESFKLPPEIQKLQVAYASGFEKYKSSRKLTWLDLLGEITVELELEDRTVTEVVKTPQAAVIYAFESDDSSLPISKTAEQLVEELQMDEELVENCLLFWVGRLVLVKSSDTNSYSVLERLPKAAHDEATIDEAAKSSTLAAAAMASATAAAAPVSALRSEDDIAEEKMQVYWQFIVGMLTNQGAMPLMRIVMFLQLAVAGGFPYSNEELRTFLGRKIDEGKLELTGGNYKLVKGTV